MRTKFAANSSSSVLQRVFDEVLALQVFDRGVFLVGLEAEHFFDRNQLESVAAAHADVRTLRAALAWRVATCCSCGRVRRAALASAARSFSARIGFSR